MEETCEVIYGGKRCQWNEKQETMPGFNTRLSQKSSILTMIGVRQDSQAQLAGGADGGKNERKKSGFDTKLSQKSTILTMIGVWQDSQTWREGGGNKEEGLWWRKGIEESCGGRYGGKKR